MSDMLYERDWNCIVDTIYDINAEEDPKRVGRIALEALFVLIPSDQIMLTYMEKTDQFNLRCKDVDTVGMPALYLDKFLGGGYNDDPYFLYCNVLKETKCFRDSDNMSDSYRESTPYLQGHLLEAGHLLQHAQLPDLQGEYRCQHLHLQLEGAR